MTHPQRFTEPYAPKVGEWWEVEGFTQPLLVGGWQV